MSYKVGQVILESLAEVVILSPSKGGRSARADEGLRRWRVSSGRSGSKNDLHQVWVVFPNSCDALCWMIAHTLIRASVCKTSSRQGRA